MEEWLTIEEAARHLKMSVPGIRKYVKNGKLPSYRQGRIIRLKQSELDTFLTPSPLRPLEHD
jgi:excisionase family DNA binding protein